MPPLKRRRRALRRPHPRHRRAADGHAYATDPVTVAASGGTGVDWALKQDEIKNDPGRAMGGVCDRLLHL